MTPVGTVQIYRNWPI